MDYIVFLIISANLLIILNPFLRLVLLKSYIYVNWISIQ